MEERSLFACKDGWNYDDEFPHFEKPSPNTPIIFESLAKGEREWKQRRGELEKNRTFTEMDIPPPYVN